LSGARGDRGRPSESCCRPEKSVGEHKTKVINFDAGGERRLGGGIVAKFRIRLKVQGLDLEVDGERQDLPAITNAVQQQLSSMVIPGEIIADGHKQLGDGGNGSGAGSEDENKKKRPGRRERRPGGDGAPASPIEFRHDAAKYGNPVQSWSVTEKSVWLLYVLKKVGAASEVSGPALAATFNQYFKAAGRVHPPLVTREFAKVKVQNPAPIGEDKNGFYLTDEGDKQAEQLIQSVLNPAK
jgi:hypothetical protein